MTIQHVRILCPPVVTGGPQALHQLAFALNRLGLPTQMAYYQGAGSFVERDATGDQVYSLGVDG